MIEKTVMNYLNRKLSPVPCYMEMPEEPSGKYVIIEKTGTSVTNRIETATFAIQSYGSSLLEAATLNDDVKWAMDDMVELDDVSRVELNSDYNYPDTALKAYRYQAVFVITHY
jgi:hypothetical protein